jgi:hypothetical protein
MVNLIKYSGYIEFVHFTLRLKKLNLTGSYHTMKFLIFAVSIDHPLLNGLFLYAAAVILRAALSTYRWQPRSPQ